MQKYPEMVQRTPGRRHVAERPSGAGGGGEAVPGGRHRCRGWQCARPETLQTTVGDERRLWKDGEHDHESRLSERQVSARQTSSLERWRAQPWKLSERQLSARQTPSLERWRVQPWKPSERQVSARQTPSLERWRAQPWKPSKRQVSARAKESSVYRTMLRQAIFLGLQTTPAHGQGYTTNTPEPGTPLSRASIWPWLLKLAATLWCFKRSLHSPF